MDKENMNDQGVALGEIKGLSISKPHSPEGEYARGYCTGFEVAISEMRDKRIRLNMERLEDIIARNLPYRCNEIGNVIMLRDAIIASQRELLECKE
jgi:hypothetical protein